MPRTVSADRRARAAQRQASRRNGSPRLVPQTGVLALRDATPRRQLDEGSVVELIGRARVAAEQPRPASTGGRRLRTSVDAAVGG
jgi:hypothetical protein